MISFHLSVKEFWTKFNKSYAAQIQDMIMK